MVERDSNVTTRSDRAAGRVPRRVASPNPPAPGSHRTVVAILALVALLSIACPANARTLLKNICRVKGQEENTLVGQGIVVGLKGTGDNANSIPTVRAL